MSGSASLFDLHKLNENIVVTLPCTAEAQVAIRHIHTIDMHQHKITVVVPARIFESSTFIPFLRQHTQTRVDEARNLLQFISGAPVPGHQKYHVCTMVSNQRLSILPSKKAAVSVQPAAFVDLVCTMPARIHGHFAQALVDTAANHSMVTRGFLDRHSIAYTASQSVTVGISGSEASCLGKVVLNTRVGRRVISVKFTVVDSLPAATGSYQPNEALFALDVISAVDMSITFKHPRIVVYVPPLRSGRRKKDKPYFHIIHAGHSKFTSESSTQDDFMCSQRELKALTSKAKHGQQPLYVAHIRPTVATSPICCAGTKKKGYLSEQVAPAHVPQDTSNIPACIKSVVDKHKGEGGTLGPPPPNTSASGFEMDIDLLPGTRPRAARQYRLTPRETLELEKQLNHLLTMGWVQPSVSPWASCVLFAPKPGGKLRLCIDYRYLNEHTVKNTYPLPRIDTLLDQLQGHKFFSALDLHSGYHQIRLSSKAGPKTAFRTPDGLYEWKVMPFGLSNAPSVFQQAMHVVLKGLIGKICLAYLDDIVVLARSEEEHAKHLDLVLTRLAEHKFYCNIDKCQFALQEIKYLGHVVTADTVQPDPYKVQVLQDWPVADLQKSTNNIRSFLGLAGYFRRFVPKFPTLAAPLLQRISSKESIPWTKQCDAAFVNIKNALVNATVMRHPDLNKPFHIYTDASDYAYGAVLTQQHEDTLCPVAWIGRKMNRAEENYYTLEKELGAIVFAYRQWRCYLENNHTVFIHSDHNPLRFLQTQKKLSGKHARWLESLSRIDWKITYIPGDKNVVADAVSRATHLPTTEVVLHDGHTLAAERPHEPYRALALTSLLVRRSPGQAPALSEGFPPLALSQPPSRGTVIMDSPRGSPSAWHTADRPAATTLFSPRTQDRQDLRRALGLLNPSNPAYPVIRDMLRQATATPTATIRGPPQPLPPLQAAASSQPVKPSSSRRAAPSRQQPNTSASLSPRPKVVNLASSPTPSSVSSELPSEVIDLEGIDLDPQTFQEIGADLNSQHNQHLTLDVAIDSFWERLRQGYAHDPAFRAPPHKYRFDKHLQAYLWGHKLVIPDHDGLRKQILLWHHVHPWHAHMGVHRTQALIMDTFYWPDISTDIKSFISQCHSCQIMKSPGCSDSTLSPLPVPTACWRVVSLDMITHLPRTASGYDCIVVFVDQFSKMVRLIPTLSTLDGPGFAKLFFQHIYPHYGLPLGICSDRGVQWNNKFFKSVCEHMGIQLRLTFSYHPRANGQVERLNRVIEEALRHFVGPAHDDWDSFLPHVEFSINSSKSESTGCSPFQLNRITPPLSPTALAFGLPQTRRVHTSILHRMYYHLAKQALSEAKQSMWSSTVHNEHSQHFQVGKDVLLSLSKLALHHPALRRKFTARWAGPCRILALIGTRAARLQLPATLRELRIHDVFHFSCLKPYVDAHFHECSTCPATGPDTDADNVFEVEAVLDYRRTHTPMAQSHDTGPLKGPHYLVRWKGYSSQHDLWLPVGELDNCLDKVADYLFQNASAKQREVMIAQFPRGARARLAHLLQRAHSTRGVDTAPATMSRPPRLVPRTRRKSARLRKSKPTLVAAVSSQQFCSCCAASLC